MSDKDWIKDLKPGDSVIVKLPSREYVTVVERETNTHIIIHGGAQFRRCDGKLIPQNIWESAELKEATQEAVCEILKEEKK